MARANHPHDDSPEVAVIGQNGEGVLSSHMAEDQTPPPRVLVYTLCKHLSRTIYDKC